MPNRKWAWVLLHCGVGNGGSVLLAQAGMGWEEEEENVEKGGFVGAMVDPKR